MTVDAIVAGGVVAVLLIGIAAGAAVVVGRWALLRIVKGPQR